MDKVIENDYLQIAANIFTYENTGDKGLLHYKLCNELHTYNGLCKAIGIEVTKEAVTLLIHNWMLRNPEQSPYGE